MVRKERDKGGDKRVMGKYKEMIRGRLFKEKCGIWTRGGTGGDREEDSGGVRSEYNQRDKVEIEETRTTLKRWKRQHV
jgi:hypothetical protein